MKLAIATTVVFLLCVVSAARAQDEPVVSVELRVTAAAGERTIVVDRGTSDGVALGDLVLFRPRDGGTYRGTVTEVDERSARVELHEGGVSIEPGTRGEVLVPESRLQPAAETPPESAEHPAWADPDEGWSQDMPLLARIKGVRPEEREPSMNGRVYFSSDNIFGEDRTDSYWRAGTDLLFENPFGDGGALHVSGELDYQAVDVPDEGSDSGAHLRVDRLSYTWGGTRWKSEGWEVGRFLQRGMPEFGVLDGVEWNERLENGDRWGASAGFMPEPSPGMQTASDLQGAMWYRWVSDLSERLSLAGGYQKSLHHGSSDRDLVVTKARWAPDSGWNAYGTAWIDLYGSDEELKSSSVEMTQAIASVGHRWESGNGFELSYRRALFPEIDRDEFPTVDDEELANGHHDRLALDGWRFVSRETRLHGGLGVWDDETESGGDAEVGLELPDLFLAASRSDFTLYGQAGETSSVLGARVTLARATGRGSWDLLYDMSHHHTQGFSDDRDDIVQHRLRAARDFGLVRGWRVSCYAEGAAWDDELALLLGVYVQKDLRR